MMVGMSALQSQAVQMAQAVAGKAAPYFVDREEYVQDFVVHVLTKLHGYEQDRGALSTWMFMVFKFWRADRAQGDRWWHPLSELEDLPLVWDDRHKISGRAADLLEMVPAKGRDLVETHLAYGVSLTATAELHGVTDRTVSRWVAEARRIWAVSHVPALG